MPPLQVSLPLVGSPLSSGACLGRHKSACSWPRMCRCCSLHHLLLLPPPSTSTTSSSQYDDPPLTPTLTPLTHPSPPTTATATCHPLPQPPHRAMSRARAPSLKAREMEGVEEELAALVASSSSSSTTTITTTTTAAAASSSSSAALLYLKMEVVDDGAIELADSDDEDFVVSAKDKQAKKAAAATVSKPKPNTFHPKFHPPALTASPFSPLLTQIMCDAQLLNVGGCTLPLPHPPMPILSSPHHPPTPTGPLPPARTPREEGCRRAVGDRQGLYSPAQDYERGKCDRESERGREREPRLATHPPTHHPSTGLHQLLLG